jgi:parvulin-like peptidyl-prolyl isomerase
VRRCVAIIGGSFVLALVSLAGASATSAGSASVPAGAVARVGDELVTRATFNHWFEIRRTDTAPRLRLRNYRPPRFAGCVGKARRARAASRRRATTAELRRRCRIEYEAQRDAVLDLLITRLWHEGEATDLGIAPTAEEYETAFQRARQDSFASESEFRTYLRRNGMTLADARFMQESGLLAEKLNEAALATAEPVSDLDVAAFLDASPAALKTPELRDARIILTKTRAAAIKARAGRSSAVGSGGTSPAGTA